MCLVSLDNNLSNPKYGYKIFKVIEEMKETKLVSEFFYEDGGKAYPIEEWIDEKDYRKICDKKKETIKIADGEYPMGFHCFYR